jgi:hypothetical protein
METLEFKTLSSVFNEEIEWFKKVIERRENLFYNRTESSTKLPYEPIQCIIPTNILNVNSNYYNFINENKLSFEERPLLILFLFHICNQSFY